MRFLILASLFVWRMGVGIVSALKLPGLSNFHLIKSNFSYRMAQFQKQPRSQLGMMTSTNAIELPQKLVDGSSERNNALKPLFSRQWKLQSGRDAIQKQYIFSDFVQCFKYMTEVAKRAEELQHHPEWFNVYNRLEVTLSTHDCNGLSIRDVTFATFMDDLFEKYRNAK